MKILNRIRVFSFAKFQAVLMALVGLLAGTLYSFGGLIIDALVSFGLITSEEIPGLSYGTVLAYGAIIVMPLLFASTGFLTGIVDAVLYNIFARWFGGLKIDFE